MPNHHVTQGECISSIALAHGLDWKTVWWLPENTRLRSERKNPNVLLPGDNVFVPEKRSRLENRPVDRRHPFVKHGLSVRLKLRLRAAGKPIANEAYVLTIGGQNLEGNTDSEGILEQPIPPDVTNATLVLTRTQRELELRLGWLDPLSEISGVQGRLNNLGYHCGAVDGIAGPQTRSALLAFQETYKLEMSGKPDNATCDRLKVLYGC